MTQPAHLLGVALRRAASLLALLCLAPLAEAQDEAADTGAVVRLEVRVTAVSGGQIYLDKGRDDLLESGDAVELWPTGGALVVTEIGFVSRSSSRALLPDGVATIQVGDRGEVLLPEARVQAAQARAEADADDAATGPDPVPEHPPWSATLEQWDPSQPLLAPAFSRPAEEKPALLSGRFYTQFNGTVDNENDNRYELWTTGVDARVENPFGRGGRLRVDADVFHRASRLDLGPDDATTRWRLDRASYAWGGTREEADRWEVGRFLQHEFPELGLLDGVEYSHRTDSGDRVGGSFGLMPVPSAVRPTGDDMQAAAFYRTDSGGQDLLEWGLAWQNTWHKGERDRDLLVGTLEARPSDDVRVTAEALVDRYGSGDTIKDDGFELTEARVHGRWRLDDETGVGLHGSHVRWPELLRNEFGPLTAAQILDNRVTRFGVDGWRDLTDDLRVDGRLDRWTDEDDSGGSGSLRATLRDVLWERGQVAAEVFVTQGAFSDGAGLRLAARKAFEHLGYGSLSWETARSQSDTAFAGSVDTDTQAFRVSLDSDLGDGWSLSTYAEHRTGDGLDSDTLGLYLQERF